MGHTSPHIDRIAVRVLRIPTDALEADGTIAWDHTTMVLVEADAGGKRGIGYTYASAAAAVVIDKTLKTIVEGGDAFDIAKHWTAMVRAVRNMGRGGVCANAISAVDIALWDLKAKLLDLPLFKL